MRVLHLLDSVHRGGAETQALDFCRNAARFGIEMTLVACGGGSLENEFRQVEGIDFVRLERRLPLDPFLIGSINKIIRERKIRIIQSYQAVEGLHAHFASAGSNAKTVLSFQGFVPDAKNRITLRFLIPRSAKNVVVSNGLSRWLAEVDGLDTSDNFEIIYNGADPERIRAEPGKLRGELQLGPEDLLMGMVGNFYRDPRKDQLTIAKALPAVFEGFPSARFAFVGKTESGAEAKREECRSICERNGILDRVYFLGGRDDVPSILADLDLFVFSSLQEGLPVALTEAMLAGVPSVVSDIEPHIEASGEGKFASVFKTQDAAALSQKMSELLGDAGSRQDLARRALEHAQANFSIDAHIKRFVELYEKLISA